MEGFRLKTIIIGLLVAISSTQLCAWNIAAMAKSVTSCFWQPEKPIQSCFKIAALGGAGYWLYRWWKQPKIDTTPGRMEPAREVNIQNEIQSLHDLCCQDITAIQNKDQENIIDLLTYTLLCNRLREALTQKFCRTPLINAYNDAQEEYFEARNAYYESMRSKWGAEQSAQAQAAARYAAGVMIGIITRAIGNAGAVTVNQGMRIGFDFGYSKAEKIINPPIRETITIQELQKNLKHAIDGDLHPTSDQTRSLMERISAQHVVGLTELQKKVFEDVQKKYIAAFNFCMESNDRGALTSPRIVGLYNIGWRAGYLKQALDTVVNPSCRVPGDNTVYSKKMTEDIRFLLEKIKEFLLNPDNPNKETLIEELQIFSNFEVEFDQVQSLINRLRSCCEEILKDGLTLQEKELLLYEIGLYHGNMVGSLRGFDVELNAVASAPKPTVALAPVVAASSGQLPAAVRQALTLGRSA